MFRFPHARRVSSEASVFGCSEQRTCCCSWIHSSGSEMTSIARTCAFHVKARSFIRLSVSGCSWPSSLFRLFPASSTLIRRSQVNLTGQRRGMLLAEYPLHRHQYLHLQLFRLFLASLITIYQRQAGHWLLCQVTFVRSLDDPHKMPPGVRCRHTSNVAC